MTNGSKYIKIELCLQFIIIGSIGINEMPTDYFGYRERKPLKCVLFSECLTAFTLSLLRSGVLSPSAGMKGFHIYYVRLCGNDT